MGRDLEHKRAYDRKYNRYYYDNYKRPDRGLKRAQVADIKAAMGCDRCSERDPACLVFHHRNRRTKKAAVTTLVSFNASWAEIRAEIAKCVVLCANCHAKEHAAKRKPASSQRVLKRLARHRRKMDKRRGLRSTNKFLTYGGRTQTCAQWCDELGLRRPTISNRLKRGWTDKEILFGKIKTLKAAV